MDACAEAGQWREAITLLRRLEAEFLPSLPTPPQTIPSPPSPPTPPTDIQSETIESVGGTVGPKVRYPNLLASAADLTDIYPTDVHPADTQYLEATARLKRVEHLKRTVLSSFMPDFQTKIKIKTTSKRGAPTEPPTERSTERSTDGERGGLGGLGGVDLRLNTASTESASTESAAGSNPLKDPLKDPLKVPPSALASSFLAAALEQSRAQSQSAVASAPARANNPTATQSPSQAAPPRTTTAAFAGREEGGGGRGAAAATTPRSQIPLVHAAYGHAINACANAHAHSVDRPTDPDEATTDPELLEARSQAQALLAELRDRYGGWPTISYKYSKLK